MIALPVTAEDRAQAHECARTIAAQGWRVDHTETSWLTDYETALWGWLAELALARYLGVSLQIELDGSHPCADITAGGIRYEVRGTPWIRRAQFDLGTYRTFVYPREVRDPRLIIARVDSFLAGARIYLSGWLRAADAARWPLDEGRHLTRHAVLPEGLRDPATMPLPAVRDGSAIVRNDGERTREDT